MAYLLAIPGLFFGGEAAASIFSFSRILNFGSLFGTLSGGSPQNSSNSSSGISTDTILIGSVAIGGIVILSVLSNSESKKSWWNFIIYCYSITKWVS